MSFCNALFPIRVEGIAGRGPNVGSVIFLFAGKEVFPLPAPHPFSRKAKYFLVFIIYLPVAGTEPFVKRLDT